MTPEEAKEKWCPFARVAGTANPEASACNRLVRRSTEMWGLAANSFCIADKCVAWRWMANYKATENGPVETTPTKGYCGLAGQP